MEILVDGDRFAVPLYHGTSSLFYDSIRHCGLGSRWPLEEWRVLDFFREVIVAARQVLAGDEDWLVNEWYIERMAAQVSGPANWRHGQTYLSPSRQTAVQYAAGHHFGSELLTTALVWYEKVVQRSGSIDLASRYGQLTTLLAVPAKPLLIELRDVPLSLLRGERGEDAIAVVARMEESVAQVRGVSPDTLWQQMNFEAHWPLAGVEHRFWSIEVTADRPWGYEYELTPII
jgi:hypothetical protein